MRNAEQYPFLCGDPTLGEASFRPYFLFTIGVAVVHKNSPPLLRGGRGDLIPNL
jgi:hypothetical protein